MRSDSDDNSRITMGAIAAANLLETSDHDADILSVPFALLRTTGPDGFRSAQLHFTAIESQGWEHYFNTAGRDGMGICQNFPLARKTNFALDC